MKITGLALSAIVLFLGIYTLVTDNYSVMPYFQLFVGLLFLFLGLIQFRENHKVLGIFLLVASAFTLYGSVA
ncbi:DUF3953 domain-containing protein [Sporosarcina jeotgali]|uniref:DUF3953 domain-containing protein n=1 Tax=Sporosarcina jeotgali TaxID=3020056 RepID=A0ABZ0KTI4_9BACL|nr:DUF3953 domain-containing protein [Sporosarcina sp. B2O-1]WOV83279.1 DUF3953 domain-containing protein [Sporosarcina sp. B2O-1]